MMDFKNLKYPKSTPIKASKLRETLFASLDSVYSTNATLVVEKSGIPIAYIVSPETYKQMDLKDKKASEDAEFKKILDDTRGMFADDPIFEKDLKERRKIELIAAKRRKNAW